MSDKVMEVVQASIEQNDAFLLTLGEIIDSGPSVNSDLLVSVRDRIEHSNSALVDVLCFYSTLRHHRTTDGRQ